MFKFTNSSRGIFIAIICILTLSNLPARADNTEYLLDQKTILDEKTLDLTFPWEISDGAQFKFKFNETPMQGKNLNVDFSFSSQVPNINKELARIKKGELVYEPDGSVWAFEYNTEIHSIFAILNFSLSCTSAKGALTSSPNYSVFRLINGFKSYDFKSGGGLSISDWAAARNIKPENQLFENQNRISYLVPKDCNKLLMRTNARLYVAYSGAWFYQYNGVRYKPSSANVRPPVTENKWPDYTIYTFGKISTPTPSKSPLLNKTTPKPTVSNTAIKIVKEGANCTQPGKITNSGGVNYICGKVANKLIWIATTASGSKSSTSPFPTSAAKNCSTDSRWVKGYIGSDVKTEPGFPLTALVFENLSDCNLAISATASFLCPDGGVQKLTNTILSTGNIPLSPRQKLTISLQINKYFPQATQQCYLLTGYRTNLVNINTYSSSPIKALILSATP